MASNGGREQPDRTDEEEFTTSTGWRIVGPEACALADQLNLTTHDLVAVPEAAAPLFVAVFTVQARQHGANAANFILDALNSEIRTGDPDEPRLVRDEPLERPQGRFEGLRWGHEWSPSGEWTGELIWRHPHPVIRGAPCTSQVIIEERKHYTRLWVRVVANEGRRSVRGAVGAGQARPRFLDKLKNSLHFTFHAEEAMPRHVSGENIKPMAEDELLSPNRREPIAVLAPLESGGFVIEPEQVAWELLGIAHLRVIDHHPDTFILSDVLGDRRLSCYWGALRIYHPGLTRSDDPRSHPLLIEDRLVDPVIRATEFGMAAMEEAGRAALPQGPLSTSTTQEKSQGPSFHEDTKQARSSRLPASSGQPQAAMSTKRKQGEAASEVAPKGGAPKEEKHPPAQEGHAESAPTQETQQAESKDDAGVEQLRDELHLVRSTLERMVEGQEEILGQLRRLGTLTTLRSANTNALERRLENLEHLLSPPTEPDTQRTEEGAEAGEAADEDEGRLSLVDVVRTATDLHSEELLILDSAIKAAEQSPYEDPERLGAILSAMAEIASKRQGGTLDTSLKEAFRDLGLDYRPRISESTSKQLRQQHLFTGPDGVVYECHEHIALGGTYNPRRCLRIYFTSRVLGEPRFVIGHIGRHLRVPSTT